MKSIRITCKSGYSTSIDELKPLQGDLKELSKENYAKLKKEIITEGFDAPFFVWTESANARWILDGHQRLRTLIKMREEGFEVGDLPYIPIEAQDMAEAKRKLLGYASQYGSITSQGLYEFLEKSNIPFDEMDARFRFPEIKNDQFKDEYYQDPVVEGEDDVPEIADAGRVALGDLYILGNHRLLCGDATLSANISLLMTGEKADITFTSPPYNVGKTPNGNDQKYLNDSDDMLGEDYFKFLIKFTEKALNISEFVFVNIQSLSGNKISLLCYLYEMRMYYADTIIWDKESAEPAMAKNCLNSQFEYVHIFSKKANRIIGCKEFRGTLSNVFRLNSRKDKEFASVHKATFPVAFAEHFINQFSLQTVFDPFGGSGSTLIAAEKLKRKCYAMELDPQYCAVIIERWQKFSGKQAFRQNADGSLTSYEELKNG